ncbi:MAG TPA: YraN family protein [Puia sp.]|uniref:YraN family protein n=1 Tax=Puia sp. TaxID=2045100 RepID=UPI002CC6D474|nr:YraN family protein [Puia sp.]HVU97015.1 YraN family protein [Puia sp.]
MLSKTEVGTGGEKLAAQWLTKQGFTILLRNFRHGRYEVDIIAGRDSVLHFIEVKCRRSTTYGHPEESVSRKKLEHILQGGAGWLLRWPGYRRVQYDVLAITLRHPTPPEYLLFEDVYL